MITYALIYVLVGIAIVSWVEYGKELIWKTLAWPFYLVVCALGIFFMFRKII